MIHIDRSRASGLDKISCSALSRTEGDIDVEQPPSTMKSGLRAIDLPGLRGACYSLEKAGPNAALDTLAFPRVYCSGIQSLILDCGEIFH